jgi:hypothetical protein
MRLRILNLVLPVAVCAIASGPVAGADGSGSSTSTIRIVSSAPAAAPEASPQRIVVPPLPAERIPAPPVERPEVAPIQFVAPPPPARSAERYPVQQAIHAAPNAAAPGVVAAPIADAAPTAVAAPQAAPTRGRVPPIVNVHSRPNAQATLSRMPRRMTVQPRPKAPAAPARGKPFQAIQMEPAVSAYLNMYRRESDGGNVPNYFAFVLPQLEQQEANRQQAAELQKLRGQVQGLTAAGGAPNSANMSAHARYMDTAQYYGGMKR